MEEVLQQHPKLHLCGMQHIHCHVLAPLPGDRQHLGVQGGRGLLTSLCLCFSPGGRSEGQQHPQAGQLSTVSDHVWYPGPEGQKARMHCESSGVTDAVLLPGQTVVVGQILCRQRVFLTPRQTPFPAECPAQSGCPWLSPQHQPSKGRVDGEVGSRYPTGAASIRQGNVRSTEVAVCGLWGPSHHQEKSQENQGWMVSPFSPAKKRVGCCAAGPATAAPQRQWAEMQQRGELASECTCRSSGKGKSEGSGGPAKSRAVYTRPLCRNEWRHEIQSVNPEISRD